MSFTERYVTGSGGGTHDGTSEANAYTFVEMVTDISTNGAAAARAGYRYNVKVGTHSVGADQSIANSGTVTSPIVIRGYSSTIGDGYLGRTNGNGALITTNFPTIALGSGFRWLISGNYVVVECLNVTGNYGGGMVGPSGTDCKLSRLSVTNSNATNAAIGVAMAGQREHLFDSDVTVTAASGGTTGCAVSQATRNRVTGCRLKCTNNVGLRTSTDCVVAKNTIYANGSHGISIPTAASAFILDNTIVGNGGDGINLTTGGANTQDIIGNLITDNTAYGINGVSAANAAFVAYNRLDRNTSGATNLATDWIAGTSYGHNITGVTQAQEYNAAGSNDYRLVTATSPAVANNSPAYGAIGSLQPQSSGGGISVGKFALAAMGGSPA